MEYHFFTAIWPRILRTGMFPPHFKNVRCHFCRLPRSRFLGTSVYIDLPISSSSDKHSSLHLQYHFCVQYHFYHCGVGLYINELIPYRILEKESTSSFQALWCELNMRKGKNIICGVVYRRHNCPDHFLEYLSSKLETLCARNNETILLGDFNIDLLKIESCRYSQKLFETLQSLSLLPTIDKPTRS